MTPAAKAALERGEIENFVTATTPGGIEAQEKRGQIEQSFAETLPAELQDRQAFIDAGFVLGAPIDRLFIKATFPKGWRKKPTDHDMWTDIIDETGEKRGGIFYKAAFYDQRASAHLT